MDNKIIGVLTPYFGSFYFGTIMKALHDAALQVGASLISIRTTYIDPHDLLANDNVVGWIIVQNAVSNPYIARLAAQGKPIVSIGNQIPLEYGQTLSSDNEQGMMQAVEHLIEHGHRQIAFVGYLDLDDMKARFIGYKKALEKHGIPYNPDLVIDSIVRGNESGWLAAEMIKRGEVPCTAIAACTDLTAIGLTKHLEDFGYRVPEDYAITGYDDSFAAQINSPSISSVNQDLERISSKAIDMLMHALDGMPLSPETVYLPNTLQVRSSCGCMEQPDNVQARLSETPTQHNDHAANMMHNFELYQFMIASNKPGLGDLARLMSPYFNWGCLATLDFNDPDSAMLSMDQSFHFGLSDDVAITTTIAPESFPPLSFYSSLEKPTGDHQNMTHIIPIRVGDAEQSYLAMVSSGEHTPTTTMYALIVQYLDLLAFSLERNASHQELLTQTEKYRRIAEQLEIVSRTTNDGIWDWDLASQTFECNGHFLKLIGLVVTSSKQPLHESEFLNLIHEDDLELLKAHLHSHLNVHSPFAIDFRIKHHAGGYIWLTTAGEAIRDLDGKPIRMIGSVRDISDRKRYEQQMVFLAFHDPLTRLVNRTRFYTLINEYVNQPDGLPFALLLLDLDGFKSVNDQFGHQMGDQVLIYVATLLKGLIARPDHIARFGGDEFVILQPISPDTDIRHIAHTIVNTIQTSLSTNYPQILVTGSLGISMFPEHSLDPELLIKYADTAMYIAKQEEKNTFRMFHPSMLSQ
jgi:diguanylate cyclase (GGDEF)-like protein/PAS domain S-box-containing protein